MFGRVTRDVAKAQKLQVQPRDLLFDRQLAVLADTAQFKALLCGRRAGKTDAVIKDFAQGMLDEPGSNNLFVALTLDSAREILWKPFKALNELHGWGFKLDHNLHVISHPNGSQLLVRGADDARQLEKPRGQKFRRIRIDECGAHRPTYLRYLVEEVLEPTLMDNPSADMWLCGTCTPQAYGFFYEITTGARTGYSVHGWTAQQNPHVDWDGFVYGRPGRPGLFERRGWDETHPIFRREYLAEWVIDSERKVYRFERVRNVVDKLPSLAPGDSWMRVLGLDFGVGDATAAAVVAGPRKFGKDAYVEHTWQRTGLAPSDAATLIWRTVQQFKPDLIVGDVGGLGKAFWAEWNKRFPGVEMKAANKQDKRGTLEIVSDLLYTARSGGGFADRRGLMVLDDNEELIGQWIGLQWDEERKDIAEGQDDDLADAAMYAVKELPCYANALELPPPEEDYRGTNFEFRPPKDRHLTPQQRGLLADWRPRFGKTGPRW